MPENGRWDLIRLVKVKLTLPVLQRMMSRTASFKHLHLKLSLLSLRVRRRKYCTSLTPKFIGLANVFCFFHLCKHFIRNSNHHAAPTFQNSCHRKRFFFHRINVLLTMNELLPNVLFKVKIPT